MFDGSAIAITSVEPDRFTGTHWWRSATWCGISSMTLSGMSISSRLTDGTPWTLLKNEVMSDSLISPWRTSSWLRLFWLVRERSLARWSWLGETSFSRMSSSPIRSWLAMCALSDA